MPPEQGQARVGTSGYQYDHWAGRFYPDDLPQDRWLEHYAEHFGVVEINNTFYQLPDADTFERWHDTAPSGFRFVLKYNRFGSHMKKLKDPASHLDPFADRAARLKRRLDAVLVQLPPHWHADPPRLNAFLDAAPTRWRWAVEFRDESWLCDAVFDVLREHDAALCVHDMIADHPRVRTADWVYLRLHGPGPGGAYPHQALIAWADWIAQQCRDGHDVLTFFNNDAHGYAIRDAQRLIGYLDDRTG